MARDAQQINAWFKAMNRRKVFQEDMGLPDIERLTEYYLRFFKGTFYRKILARNLRVQFSCGYFFPCRPYPLHFHKALELTYIRHGTGACYLAGKTYHFQKRLLLIAKPNEIHATMSMKEEVAWSCLIFPLDWLGMDLDVSSWPHEILLGENEAARFDLVCGQVSEEVKNKGFGYEDMIRTKFQEICGLARRIVSQPKKERANPLVDQLREYVDRHFAEKTNLLNISKDFGYTEQYLYQVFKESMGLSLKRYILQRRIIEARILLETRPELKLAVIAGQVGFEDYRLFHRIFKILSGVKPESYRRVIQKAVVKKRDADQP